MSTAMYDAREALIPGSVYDRSNNGEKAKKTDCFCNVRQFTLGKKRGLIVFSIYYRTYIQYVFPDP